MGAETWWKVKYLKLVDDEVEVQAVTADDAERAAKELVDAARILDVTWMHPEDH